MSRCIDADALRDRLQNLGYDDWNQGATTTWAEAFSECADMVDEAPTIEPQRKKGEWTVKEGDLAFWDVCSVCRKVVIHMVPHYNFCPNCGADMRGEQE